MRKKAIENFKKMINGDIEGILKHLSKGLYLSVLLMDDGGEYAVHIYKNIDGDSFLALDYIKGDRKEESVDFGKFTNLKEKLEKISRTY